MSDIAYRPYRSDDETGLRALFSAVYGPDAGRRTSAWRYLAPGPYPVLIQVAEADGRIVGAQPSHGIDLCVQGQPVKGLLLLDVMTHPEYRRRGVFVGVVEGLRRRSAAEGYRILLTTPNRQAERGFARLPAWRRMGDLVPWVFVADPATLLGGSGAWRNLLIPLAALRRGFHGGAGRDDSAGAPPADGIIEDLWRRCAGEAPCQVCRGATFVRWRFGPLAGRSYRSWAAMTAGVLTGLLVTRAGRLLGRPVTYLSDVMVPGASHGAARDVLRAITGRAVAEKNAAVIGWFAPRSRAGALLRSAGFLSVPRALRPRPYGVWACTNLPGETQAVVLDLTRWHMTLADSDLA